MMGLSCRWIVGDVEDVKTQALENMERQDAEALITTVHILSRLPYPLPPLPFSHIFVLVQQY